MQNWNPNQIRALEWAITDSLPNVTGLEVVDIEDRLFGAWRVVYKYEDSQGRERQGVDYITGHLTENGFEDFQLQE